MTANTSAPSRKHRRREPTAANGKCTSGSNIESLRSYFLTKVRQLDPNIADSIVKEHGRQQLHGGPFSAQLGARAFSSADEFADYVPGVERAAALRRKDSEQSTSPPKREDKKSPLEHFMPCPVPPSFGRRTHTSPRPCDVLRTIDRIRTREQALLTFLPTRHVEEFVTLEDLTILRGKGTDATPLSARSSVSATSETSPKTDAPDTTTHEKSRAVSFDVSKKSIASLEKLQRAFQKRGSDNKKLERAQMQGRLKTLQKLAEMQELPLDEELKMRRQLSQVLKVPLLEQIKLNMTNMQVDEYRKAFSLFDVDGNSVITSKELFQILNYLKIVETEAEAEEIIMSLDENKSGSIDFPEFLRLVSRKNNLFVSTRATRKSKLPLTPGRAPGSSSEGEDKEDGWHLKEAEKFAGFKLKGMGNAFRSLKRDTKKSIVSVKPVTKQRNLTQEEFENIRKAFGELDVDGSGELSLGELVAAGETVCGRRFDASMFAKWDKDRSGYISLLEMLREWYPTTPVKELERMLEKSQAASTRGKKNATDFAGDIDFFSLDEVCEIYDHYYAGTLTFERLFSLARHTRLSPTELAEYLEKRRKDFTVPSRVPILDILRGMYGSNAVGSTSYVAQ